MASVALIGVLREPRPALGTQCHRIPSTQPPLPSAVRLCHLCLEGLLCSWTKDRGAWRPYCLESDCLTQTHQGPVHIRRPSQEEQRVRSSHLTLPALVSTSALVLLSPGHLGLWFIWH